MVFKYELLEEFIDRQDEDEDYIKKESLDKELRFFCNQLYVIADPMLTAAYQLKRISRMKDKKGPYHTKQERVAEITKIEENIGPVPARYIYQLVAVNQNYAAILQPFGWVSVIDLRYSCLYQPNYISTL